MVKRWWIVSVVAVCLHCFTTQAADIAFEAPITEGKTSVRSVQLPLEVLKTAQQVDLSDVQVVNAAGQTVPMTIQPLTPPIAQAERHALSVFRAADTEQLGSVMTLTPDATVNIKRLAQQGEPYLIVYDAAFKAGSAPVHTLHLEWSPLTQPLMPALKVEASDDLVHWREVSIASLPYQLKEQNVVLENHELILQTPIHTKFLRLIGQGSSAELIKNITTIQGEFSASPQQAGLVWGRLPLTATSEARVYRVSVPPSLVIEQWQLPMTQAGSFYNGEWRISTPLVPSTEHHHLQRLRRNSTASQFYSVPFQQYWLKTLAGDVRSKPMMSSGESPSSWLLSFAPNSALPEVLELEVAWRPLELRFVAQGQGPFTLRWGNATSQTPPHSSASTLNEVQPETVQLGSITSSPKSNVVANNVTPATKGVLATTWLLWLLLGLAVIVLLGMAYRLWQEMQSKAS